ncbi:CCHC-type domain-containing protein [Trichonephila clavipes]|nr:CCHC-type domain-containing protein [Trichonephila clavipes]
MEFYHHLPSWAMNEHMSYFSSFSDEWSRDLEKKKEIPVVFKYRNSVHVEEEEAKELLEVITAERLETEQQQKLEQQEQLSIEKLRLEIELSRNANQSATQNNGQTPRVKSLDEIVKMVRLLTVKVPNKSDGWDYFSSLEKAFASEMVSDESKPKVLLCMLGDKVSNLLVNLGEEELKDYESLKQVVLKEKNFDKGQVTEIKKFACFTCGSDKHFKRDCPKNKEVDNKRLNVNKVSTEGTELVDGTVAARVDLLGKVIPRRAIEDKLSKLVKTSISVDGNVLLPPEVLDMLGGAQSEENSLAQSSRDLRVDSGNVDETEVSSGILPEKAQEHIEDSQRNITSCRNEVGTLGTKDEEVTAEMDKGIMVADSFRSNRSVVPS